MNSEDILRQFLSYSERLNDVPVGKLDYNLHEVTSNVETTLRELNSPDTEGTMPNTPYSTTELSGITVDRNDQIYFVGTADDLGYAKVYYVQNLVENMMFDSALKAGENATLEDSEIDIEEGINRLANNRNASIDELHYTILNLLSDSNCDFYIEKSDEGDITYFEISQKVFPETSLQDYDQTIQQVVNTGLKTMNEFHNFYDLDSIGSQYLKTLKDF